MSISTAAPTRWSRSRARSWSSTVAEHDPDLPFVDDPDGKARAAFGFADLPGARRHRPRGDNPLTREGYNAAEEHPREDLVKLIESL